MKRCSIVATSYRTSVTPERGLSTSKERRRVRRGGVLTQPNERRSKAGCASKRTVSPLRLARQRPRPEPHRLPALASLRVPTRVSGNVTRADRQFRRDHRSAVTKIRDEQMPGRAAGLRNCSTPWDGGALVFTAKVDGDPVRFVISTSRREL
jgi:hypothetical protein